MGEKLDKANNGRSESTAALTPKSAWPAVCERLRGEFGDEVFRAWIGPLVLTGAANGEVRLGVESAFRRDWVSRHYLDRIRAHFVALGLDIRVVTIAVTGGKSSSANAETAKKSGSDNSDGSNMDRRDEPAAEEFGGGLNPAFTFESFVVGKSNELAYAAARRVAEAKTVPFNPLFLHGGVGLGKTHLMHAIAWEYQRHHPKKKVMYLSAERFMYQFISALRYKDTMAFKRQFRNVDLLMIDDVQFIGNKDSTQEEFFHTFNALVDNRRQIVISADRSPTDLEGIEERIVSRLGWGLVADIHATDYELRLGILQSKAERKARETGVSIEKDVLEFLARRITSNVRELEGALLRLILNAELVGRNVTADLARDVLQDLLRANDRKVTIDEIQRQVADYYNLRLGEMLSERRARNIARPRQVAMYLSKQMTSRSLPEIGRKFNGRDHTTVMHAVRVVDDLRRSDAGLDEDIHRLSRILQG